MLSDVNILCQGDTREVGARATRTEEVRGGWWVSEGEDHRMPCICICSSGVEGLCEFVLWHVYYRRIIDKVCAINVKIF